MAPEGWNIRGGGGITRGSVHGGGADDADLGRAFRRRWASGVAVLTTGEPGAWRGITVTALMPLSLEPPTIVVGLTGGGAFAATLDTGAAVGVSLLHREQAMLADRFAGRGPVPDGDLTGVPIEMTGAGVPVLGASAATLAGMVREIQPMGDHLLVMLDVVEGIVGEDQDDPLIAYQGAYRNLEIG